MSKQPKSIPPKPRLGRGLSSLIPQASVAAELPSEYQPSHRHTTASPDNLPADLPLHASARGLDIPIDQIGPNPFQPRRAFNDAELDELADSIARQGILQPLLVRPASDPTAQNPYVLIAGERRLRAAAKAGLAAVPCIVRQATNQQLLEWALVENIHREDLNPIERASAYREYIDRFGLTQIQCAERLGQPRATIANYLRLLDLESATQALIAEGGISFGHAKVLVALGGPPARQLAIARRIVREGLSVRQVEQIVASAHHPADSPTPSASTHAKPPYIGDLEERLSSAMGMRVTIQSARRKHTGRVTIQYYSLDDFDRIAAALGVKDGDG